MGFLHWFFAPLKNQKSESIREQALANMRAARERIGEDEIQKMAGSLRDETMKARAHRARAEILAADKARVATHVRTLLDKEE